MNQLDKIVANPELRRISKCNHKIAELQDERDKVINRLYKEFGKNEIDQLYKDYELGLR